MVSSEVIDRINFLTRKARTQGLTQLEQLEQRKLRALYLTCLRRDFHELIEQADQQAHHSARLLCIR